MVPGRVGALRRRGCDRPLFAGAGTQRIVRGGSYTNSVHECRSARRSALYPAAGVAGVGLRPVRTATAG